MPEYFRDKSFSTFSEDKGWRALKATGLVPEGAVFLSNHFNTATYHRPLEELIKMYEKEGFEVTVIKDSAFDTHGQKIKGDALVGIKRG